MSDDYLFDGQGRDAEVERLEGLLAPLRHRPRPFVAPRAPRRVLIALAIAAGVLVAATATLTFLERYDSRPGYVVTVDGKQTTARRGSAIRVEGAAADVELAGIGTLRAESGALLTVLEIDPERQRLRLERGTIEARIGYGVRPRLFQVETPATTCVDLGCRYTLTVDDAGGARVRVLTGRVAFADRGREVYIPAGASCRAVKGVGSGTPLFDDAPLVLMAAVFHFDRATPGERGAVARIVAALADRPEDSLVLWHMLADDSSEVREAALNGLLRTRALPEGASREATLAREPGALEAWRTALAVEWAR